MSNQEKITQNVKNFFQAWKDLDYAKMHSLTTETWKSEHTKTNTRKLFPNRLKSYEVEKIAVHSKCLVEVILKVKYKGAVKRIGCRLICEKDPYSPSIEGTWGVNPLSIIRNLY